jgi:hypothetical protein
MGRPKGSTNKKKEPVIENKIEVDLKSNESISEVAKELDKKSSEGVDLGDIDIRAISTQSRKRVSLSNPEFDPFTKFKTEKGMYYRAINTRPHNLRKREAEGYKTIPGSEYGDLVLAKLPKEIRTEREGYIKEKTLNQTRAAVDQFKESAEKSGIKTYEEK